MLSDIYGEDKREKFLIIKNLMKDKDCIGVVYGKKGTGKRYLINKVINEIKKDKDIILFIDAQENWYQSILSEIGIYEEVGREEFLIRFFEFLQKFKGRMFIVFNNCHLLSEEQFLQIVRVLGIKDKVSLIFIGDEKTRNLLNPVNTGKILSTINFAFEIKPIEFDEFFRFFKDRYGGKLSKRKIKKLFKISHGSLSEGISIVESGKDLHGRRWWLYLVFLFLTVAIFLLYLSGKKQQKQIVVKDMKLPIEGSVEDSLPIKVKKKKTVLELNEAEIEKKLKEIYSLDIPEIKFYEKRYMYRLQVATFKNLKNAERLKEKLSQRGLHTRIEKVKGFFKLTVYVSDRNELKKVLKSLKDMGFKPILKKVE
ncbi:hypothetical protein GWK41_01320 [Persephonella atlantica]|uniref:SPOR domain-containing protein n=1 Tax=Persephonella atlantica TaxID=2699429 RepID=A0ABS1GFJ7_9AQUI|nr:SPOR domain-containing protein [Persephonella atlantica]MBK3331703.1 hypothetical protein [Persephonella atlantica]